MLVCNEAKIRDCFIDCYRACTDNPYCSAISCVKTCRKVCGGRECWPGHLKEACFRVCLAKCSETCREKFSRSGLSCPELCMLICE